MKCSKGNILSNKQIAKDTFEMIIAMDTTKTMQPGQFVNLKIEGFMLRRPISISSIEEQTFTIVYKVVGDGTEKLSTMKEQEYIDILGPLGNGYEIDKQEETILIIGGGVGVPPMYEVAKQYCALGKHVDVVLGFNDQASVFYEKEFASLGANVYIATMDGSYGVKGTVMDAIQQAKITTDYVCACGPVPMLKAIEQTYTRGYMSFESRMACGIGTCMACVAKDKKEADLYHRICKEGPVFPIGKVAF